MVAPFQVSLLLNCCYRRQHPPTDITLTKYSASSSNSVAFEFDATDAKSKQYSDVNPNVGRKGIKQFTIALKDQEGYFSPN